jgi:hypothetical protein
MILKSFAKSYDLGYRMNILIASILVFSAENEINIKFRESSRPLDLISRLKRYFLALGLNKKVP